MYQTFHACLALLNEEQSCHRSNNKVDDFIKRIQTPLPVLETAGPKASTEEVVSAPVKKSKRSEIKVIPKQARAMDMDGREGAGTITAEGRSTAHSTATVHKWLESIDKFAFELKTLMANIWRGSHTGDEIRVALIDDGVDLLEKEFRERILHGKSFAAYGHDRNQREKPWYVSDRGHGTVMAHMILRVCPMAKIYPIRLETTTDPRSPSKIDPESAIRVRALDPFIPVIATNITSCRPSKQQWQRMSMSSPCPGQWNHLRAGPKPSSTESWPWPRREIS